MSAFESVFNHLVLPPKVPGTHDTHYAAVSRDLVDRLVDGVDFLTKHVPAEQKPALVTLGRSIGTCGRINRGYLDKALLVKAFATIEEQPLILHMETQNAALVIRLHKNDPQLVVFEAFEASPHTTAVLAAEGPLSWDFPGRAASIKLSSFQDPKFQEGLGLFLEGASMETLSDFSATVLKAGDKSEEVRDTPNPGLITKCLMPLLEHFGSQEQVPLLRKRVRDTVNIDNAMRPWRRHPFWLVLRVAVQRQLCLALGDLQGRAVYKCLIVIVLIHLLKQSPIRVSAEMTLLLKRKLCRRLAKLELESAGQDDSSTCHCLLKALGPGFGATIESVSEEMRTTWAAFKRQKTRKVSRLTPAQCRASNQDFVLPLSCSGKFLDNLLQSYSPGTSQNSTSSGLNITDEGIKMVQKFTEKYRGLADFEKSLKNVVDRYESDIDQFSRQEMIAICIELAGYISNYSKKVGDAYKSNRLQQSSFLLNVFDLWRLLDMFCCRVSPLLLDHHPIFTPELLNCLQLPDPRDVLRLQIIQSHLKSRASPHSLPDILTYCDSESCFQCRLFSSCPDMVAAETEILRISLSRRIQKKEEWDRQFNEWERLTEIFLQIEACSCPYGEYNRYTQEDVDNKTVCKKCRALRARKRLWIHVHEDFLPVGKPFRRAAILFELNLPPYLALYRETAWLIVRDLAHPTWPIMKEEDEPPLLLAGFKQLQPFTSGVAGHGDIVTLASYKKSWLQTHYKEMKIHGQTDERDVIHSFAPDFHLYDQQRKIWIEDFDRKALTLEHLCGIGLPTALKEVVPRVAHPPPTVMGPSSYQLLANQTLCPRNVSLHEFSAYQRLLFGSSQRWVNILVELGSANLNFSNEDTVQMLAELAVRAGPQSQRPHRLREAFKTFEDSAFCEQLAEQIRNRLATIKSNWREGNSVTLLLVLSECLLEFGDSTAGRELIMSIRNITLDWIRRLRHDPFNAADTSANAGYAFMAAILCRRTFSRETATWNSEDLSTYCEASIALHQSTPASIAEKAGIKSMMIHDTKVVNRLDRIISDAVAEHPHSLDIAVGQAWPSSDAYKFSPWVLDPSNHGWVFSKLEIQASQFSSFHTVHFNYLDGFLLLDSKPVGGLPMKIRSSQVFKKLFKDAHLQTITTNRNGMSHRLINQHKGNEVYFGIRYPGSSDEVVVVQMTSRHGVVEFVPSTVFTNEHDFDLPIKLRDDSCVHFINYTTNCLEIRRHVWSLAPRDWVLNLRTRTCFRGTPGRLSRLLSPKSRLGNSLVQSFEHFERPEGLVLYMSPANNPHVEVSRFELTFFVNPKGLLQDNKSNMEFDENQDAGTFYGLLSKIVLRGIKDPSKRSIIVPLGDPEYRLFGPHMEIVMRKCDTINVVKFDINRVLGRLETPPEPALVFAKAYFHALTSFALPDPLIARTGMEEAFHILRSGAAQPWQSFGALALKYLEHISQLSPKRRFYPEDKRRLQSVQWDPCLLITTQHDHLDTLVQALIYRSQQLQVFEGSRGEIEPRSPYNILRRRGEHERTLYEPRSLHPVGHSASDQYYTSRDTSERSRQSTNVASITRCLLSRHFHISGAIDLKAVLQNQKEVIGGFMEDNNFACSLSKLLEGDVIDQWGQLVQHSIDADPSRPYEIAFHLALLAYHGVQDMHQVLAAFARVDALKKLKLPYHPEFTDLEVSAPCIDKIANLIRQLSPQFVPSQKCRLVAPARQRHENKCEAESRQLAEYFIKQWPAPKPTLSISFNLPETELIDAEEALEVVLETWDKLQRNRELGLFVEKAQHILDQCTIPRPTNLACSALDQASKDRYTATNFEPSLRTLMPIPDLAKDLLPKCVMLEDTHEPLPSLRTLVTRRPMLSGGVQPLTQDFRELRVILQHFSEASDLLRQAYGEDLLKSLAALEKAGREPAEILELGDGICSKFKLQSQIYEADRLIKNQRNTIIDRIARCENVGRYEWLRLGDLWPGTGAVTLLEQLRSSQRVNFGAGMKEALVHFGLLITFRQWLGRVRHDSLHGNHRKLEELLGNTGHKNWRPVDRPDWMLMEIEGDFLIRPLQVDVAHQIISPASKQNSLTQLMMGEGKTSCIVPMAIATLADGSQIARLIVPKALLLATGQTLQNRIGGLVGRRVLHIPFSRRTPSNKDTLNLYSELHGEIRRECGVLLTTTDHILSFELSGLQRLADEKLEAATWMIAFQRQLDKVCRDIIDESDLTLGVKTQLIYPSGPQVRVDGAPQRWEVAEALLDLVDTHLDQVYKKCAGGLEIARLQVAEGFPMAHFLTQDAEDELHRLLIDDVCNGRTPFLRPARPDAVKTDLHQCIQRLLEGESNKSLRQNGATPKESLEIFENKDSAPKILLLIRGLLMNRILLVCLKKRWSVQYGIHPNRDPLAVPFEAKGVPSEQAEFGHPEVSIILTILSFYFAGLTGEDFHRSLKRVLESDDPAAEYDRFTHTCGTLPDRLRHYYVINIDDKGQVEELYSYLRLNRNVLNYYLNNFVFPVHAKQFARKLSSSSWDIPNMDMTAGAASKARTTGFSGTNDIKSLLPFNIRQDDLPMLQQTNAEVLCYLLQQRNRQYHLAADGQGRFTENKLLQRLKAMKIRILIDAGAYILEMTNEALVRTWLVGDHEAKAAVFFDKGRAWVISRNGRKQPLLASPWKDGITGELLVFFDEANCRGVDLKLAPDARAVLTLALNQTKDHTVQAAMRLRQLATTQGVVFMAPPEVHRNLVDVCGLPENTKVNSSHVVKWLLEQTCRTNESLQNLHLAQGVEFCRRKDAQLIYSRLHDTMESFGRKRYLDIIMQEERQDLEQLYGPVTDRATKGSPDEVCNSDLKQYMTILAQKRKEAAHSPKGQRIYSSALEEVEQEREVAYEVQEIRQPEKPIFYEPLKFPRLHPAVEGFARTGILQGSKGYMHAFESLRLTDIAKKFNIQGTGSRLYCSHEFSRSVNLVVGAKTSDNFLRPVEWILWSPETEAALVIIPEEAEALIPILRLAGPTAHSHLMSYAAPVTKNMAHFNSLKYFAIPSIAEEYVFPRWFRLELGIFAGRLYASFDECLEIADYLKTMGHPKNGEIVPGMEAPKAGEMLSFSDKPIGFLLEWLALRRQVQDVLQTPMGYICRGSKLQPNHPFFKAPAVEDYRHLMAQTSASSTSRDQSNESDDDDEFDDDDDNNYSHVLDGMSETMEESESEDEARDEEKFGGNDSDFDV